MAVRIGVIGTSDIARRRMIPAIKACPDFEYAGVAVASSREWDEPHSEADYAVMLEAKKAKAAEFVKLFGGNVYVGYEELLHDESIDAVYIPLPPSLHYVWGKRALENGKHVLMEKPFTVGGRQTQELVSLAKARNLAVMENYGFIYHNQFKKIKEIVKSGGIGQLREIRAAFGFPHRAAGDFRYSRKYGGGALLDCGGYTVKAACQFLSGPELVCSSLVQPASYDVDLYGTAVLRAGSVNAVLSFGMDNAYICELSVWGSSGQVLSTRAFTAPDDFESKVTLCTKEGKQEIPCGRCNQFLECLHVFRSLIDSGDGRRAEYESLELQSALLDGIMGQSQHN
jgi:hypothetical protein